jgi:hypothetical protein
MSDKVNSEIVQTGESSRKSQVVHNPENLPVCSGCKKAVYPQGTSRHWACKCTPIPHGGAASQKSGW